MTIELREKALYVINSKQRFEESVIKMLTDLFPLFLSAPLLSNSGIRRKIHTYDATTTSTQLVFVILEARVMAQEE